MNDLHKCTVIQEISKPGTDQSIYLFFNYKHNYTHCIRNSYYVHGFHFGFTQSLTHRLNYLHLRCMTSKYIAMLRLQSEVSHIYCKFLRDIENYLASGLLLNLCPICLHLKQIHVYVDLYTENRNQERMFMFSYSLLRWQLFSYFYIWYLPYSSVYILMNNFYKKR